MYIWQRKDWPKLTGKKEKFIEKQQMQQQGLIRIHETGGPDVMRWEDVTVGAPQAGQVRLRHTAVGLNYIDVYMRTGLYPIELPAVLGMEAAGVVEAVGPGVNNVAEGDRVAYPMCQGAYAEQRVIAADKLVKLPDTVSERQAAAFMLKGLTAQYLLFRSYQVKAGDAILVYAAAGGVGMLLTQWARHLGAHVIGCVGSEQKADVARANGCQDVILYNHENIPERVRAITDGAGHGREPQGQLLFELGLGVVLGVREMGFRGVQAHVLRLLGVLR